MKAMYEKADLSVSSLNTRISKMAGQLSVDEAEQLEIAAIETIGDIIDTLEINKFKLANYLDIQLHDSELKKGAGETVEPFGFLEQGHGQMPIPVFGPSDKLKRRKKRMGTAESQFYELDQIRNMIENSQAFKATDRGKRLLSTA